MKNLKKVKFNFCSLPRSFDKPLFSHIIRLNLHNKKVKTKQKTKHESFNFFRCFIPNSIEDERVFSATNLKQEQIP